MTVSNSTRLTFGCLLLIAAITCSCKKTEQGVSAPLSNEFLTTTILKLRNLKDASDKPQISYKLIGSNPAVITPDTLSLRKNSSYSCTLIILDETKSPADTVSKTIQQRANIHLFFYTASSGLNLRDSITDHDSNTPPLPLGISSQMTTGAASKGTEEIVLRHQPNVKNGTYAPGSTDLDVTFPVKIQ